MGHQLARPSARSIKILSIFIVCGGGFAHSRLVCGMDLHVAGFCAADLCVARFMCGQVARKRRVD